jgi:hypothetical protein
MEEQSLWGKIGNQRKKRKTSGGSTYIKTREVKEATGNLEGRGVIAPTSTIKAGLLSPLAP